ncbi:MAG: hypothetical protein WB660_03470 [Candidatus Sulfotelmatobacter sp.]
MKILFVVLLLCASSLAQSVASAPAVAPGCGGANVKFDVKTNKSHHPIAQPESGKAIVYFVEDDNGFESFPKPTTRVGLDGGWVGANHGDSYFYFSVDPGEHHLCASWQSLVIIGAQETTAAAHFTAEAGQAYYFRVKNVWLRDHGHGHVELLPLDNDEGQLLASRFALSTSHPKQ